MAFKTGHLPSHKGRITTTQPLEIDVVRQIKENLSTSNPRDFALFVLGCNSAFRGGDLLNLKRSDVVPLNYGILEIFVREMKTGKLRRVTLNASASNALLRHLETSSSKDDWVFEGQRGPMTVNYLSRLLKKWCLEVGVTGRIASHSLRKTFARLNHDLYDVPLSTIMFALNHDSERTTARYLGLVEADVAAVYANEI